MWKNTVMIKFSNVALLLIVLLLGGCSNFQKSSSKDSVKESDGEVYDGPEEGSLTDQAKSFEEKEKLANRSALIGAAEIDESGDHHRKVYFLYGAEHLKLENSYFDIPVVYRPAVKKWIKYFLNRGRGFFERYSARSGRYAPLMGKILEEKGLPRDLIFLAMAESGFQNHAKSWARAVGPWQFMPFTGKRYGLKIDWYVDERRDPIKATVAAAAYLKDLYELFGNWELAAAGYNAGEGKVRRAIRRYKSESFWKIRKGRYLKSETKNYVPKIMALAIIGKNLKSFGFEDIVFHEPLDFEEVEVPPMTDLVALSESLKVDFEEVQRLNPEILRWFTPIADQNYILRVPVGMKTAFENCCKNNLEQFTAKAFQEYKIKGSRSTLADVSKKFKIKKTDVLERINNLKKFSRLKRGQSVLLPFREGQSRKARMYADLYERPRRSIRRRRQYLKIVRRAKKRGRKIASPSVYYTVKKGDSLWTVSKKTGQSIDTIIASNLHILNKRQIRPGDKLAVR
jgi:membrane-bound lytic murein transglycosylase D